MSKAPSQPQPCVYDLFIAVTAIVSLSLLGWRVFLDPATEIVQLIDYFDFGVCAIFFYDFLRNLKRAPSKLKYMTTWGIFDLLSSIPVFQPFRWTRLTRAARIFRAIKSVRAIVNNSSSAYRESLVVSSFLVAELVIIGSCIGVLHFESMSPDSNLNNAGDVLWWAVVTMATVGYGDFYPVTIGGRFFAVVLMMIGIGLFAMLAGVFADILRSSAKELASNPPD